MLRTSITASTLLVSMLLPHGDLRADHHEPAEIKKAVETFYSQLSGGKFAEALAHMADGARGYVATGELTEVENAEVRQAIVGMLKEGAQRGAEMDLRPQDIKVTMHGTIAIATYTVDATIKEAGDDEAERHLNRGTLVWAKHSDGWKIIHWHVSQAADDDDDNDDDD
jgi:ketosteroid isomerase-like protein